MPYQYLTDYGSPMATLLLCESIQRGHPSQPVSAIHILDSVWVAPLQSHVQFVAATFVHSPVFDNKQHVLRMSMLDFATGLEMAFADDYPFYYLYSAEPGAPGAFLLITSFNVDVTDWGQLGTYYVEAWLDGTRVAQTPITLRRRS